MRSDTTFSERKLTTEEFSEKYWLNGDLPYQYHTAGIEDGRDEREQFIFNNIRALHILYSEYMYHDIRKLKSDLQETRRIIIKQRRDFMILLFVVLVALISVLTKIL